VLFCLWCGLLLALAWLRYFLPSRKLVVSKDKFQLCVGGRFDGLVPGSAFIGRKRLVRLQILHLVQFVVEDGLGLCPACRVEAERIQRHISGRPATASHAPAAWSASGRGCHLICSRQCRRICIGGRGVRLCADGAKTRQKPYRDEVLYFHVYFNLRSITMLVEMRGTYIYRQIRIPMVTLYDTRVPNFLVIRVFRG